MLDQVEAKISVEQLISRAGLTARQKHVLEQRYWGNQTLREIGKDLEVTQERVRQIEGKALRKLRASAGIKLDDWLPPEPLTPKPKPYSPPPGAAFDRVTVHCDHCPTIHSGHLLTTTASAKDIASTRLEVLKLGWARVDGLDLCQSCSAILRDRPVASWPSHQAESHRSSA